MSTVPKSLVVAIAVIASLLVGETAFAGSRGKNSQAVLYALDMRGTPYKWGGTSRKGVDCSGLVMMAYRRVGKDIPRVTWQQYRYLHKVKRKNLRPGDLVFFYGRSHVGLYLGRGFFIHSPKTGDVVRIARLRGWYSRNYAGAVRP